MRRPPMYRRQDVYGTPETGYRTLEDWASIHKVRVSAIIRRIRTQGVVPSAFSSPSLKTRRYQLVTDPFSGIKMTIAEHSRRLGISSMAMKERIKRMGMMNPRAWKHGTLQNRNQEIWEREKRMKLRKNPFTGQEAYDYEWAEMLDMTPGSFRDRARVFGWDHKFAWAHNSTPMPSRRVATYCGIEGEGA